jgi:protein phosphatase
VKTARSIQFEAAGLSDQGQVRDKNEDAYLADTERGLFVVADGIGGHRGGGIAAQAVVKQLPPLLDRRLPEAHGRTTKALRDAILDLNAAIRASGHRDASLRGMGSTLACLLIKGGRAYIANMGDSRVYRWRAGLTCLTQDHSLTALLVREGEISARSAARHPARGQLTRYIGMEQEIYPDVSSDRMKAGDRFLLCTDGLWSVLPDRQIAKLLVSDVDPAVICAKLIAAAKASGSRDNITCVVVLCGTPDSSRRIEAETI